MHNLKVGLLAFFLGVGCSSLHDIDGSDRTMLLPTGRAWINVLPDRPDEPRSRVFGIEINGTGGEGAFDIDLGIGDTISTADGSISGPTTVAVDFRMYEASIAVRGGVDRKRFNFHGIVGLGYHSVDLDLLSARRERVATSVDEFGPLFGLHVGFEATEWLELYLRGSVLFLNLDEALLDAAVSSQVELGARFSLCDTVSLIAGYRWWRYQQEDFNFSTDIDIRAGGLLVGVVVRF